MMFSLIRSGISAWASIMKSFDVEMKGSYEGYTTTAPFVFRKSMPIVQIPARVSKPSPMPVQVNANGVKKLRVVKKPRKTFSPTAQKSLLRDIVAYDDPTPMDLVTEVIKEADDLRELFRKMRVELEHLAQLANLQDQACVERTLEFLSDAKDDLELVDPELGVGLHDCWDSEYLGRFSEFLRVHGTKAHLKLKQKTDAIVLILQTAAQAARQCKAEYQ
ncbi:hypothetical protein BDV95DRAFT_608228 [Massariosphaeria phaeospora]|uniref:Uncharacterized protein n=1 Tax=Massariosphaeria phaeospora TaxID=100035 RepID=A0A7C8MIG5_9PLEO|nr:hypothetical protein BDV95DRAFT_608228 [Massariosphaeria phaeospora]